MDSRERQGGWNPHPHLPPSPPSLRGADSRTLPPPPPLHQFTLLSIEDEKPSRSEHRRKVRASTRKRTLPKSRERGGGERREERDRARGEPVYIRERKREGHLERDREVEREWGVVSRC